LGVAESCVGSWKSRMSVLMCPAHNARERDIQLVDANALDEEDGASPDKTDQGRAVD